MRRRTPATASAMSTIKKCLSPPSNGNSTKCHRMLVSVKRLSSIKQERQNIMTFFKVLEGAQHTCVNFSKQNYKCFTYSDWREGTFIGYRTDECYTCGKKIEDAHECLNAAC